MTITSTVGVVGKNPHYVQCDSHLIAGERFEHLDMIEIVNETIRIIAAVYSDGYVWDEKSLPGFKNRPFLIKVINPTSLQVYYVDTVRSDAKLYTCQMFVRTPNGETVTVHSEVIKVIIEGTFIFRLFTYFANVKQCHRSPP